jgi:hypothetical protein
MYFRPSWTKVKPFTAWSQPGVGTGATWLELPSDAKLGEWTVKAVIVDWMWAWDVDMEMFRGDWYWDYFDQYVEELEYNVTEEEWEWYTFSFSGPSWNTFEVTGSDVHGKFDAVIDGMDENFNLTWEVLADILANQDDMAAANAEGFETVISMLDDVLTDLIEQGADLESINDYVREIRALTQRIDRWRTESAEEMVDHIATILSAVSAVNDRVDGMWADVTGALQVGFYGLNPNDPRSMTKKIDVARAATVDAVTNALLEITTKVDVVEASLAGKIINVLNAVNAETGGLDDSIKAALQANVAYIIDNLRAKIDDSEAGLSGKIKSSTDALHGKFAGVISEIGHVANKVDAVEAKLGGVESNVGDKVDAVDASVGTKLLVAIILIVIVLILVLLPIVAPGFRMKE